MQKMLKLILTSRVYEAAFETPLEENTQLSARLGNSVWLKREDLQPVNSFKLRGAYNKIVNLDEREQQRGIITASAGNHAQGVAYAAMKLGLHALIVMPVTTPSIKINAVKHLGAEVVLHGNSYSEAAIYCSDLVEQTGMIFVSPFDDELVIAGQGTIADEILRQSATRPDAIFVPVGGGGLIAGIASFIKALQPKIKVIGVQPIDSDAMSQSIETGQRVQLESVGIFADGVAVKKVGKKTFELCRKYVDEMILVTTDELCSGIKDVYQATRSIVEPAGALGLAGLSKYVRDNNVTGQTLIAITSGANMNFEQLRYVAERTLVGEKREGLFVVTIPEGPGTLRHFCREIIDTHNITEFSYRLSSRKKAHIYIGVSVQNESELYNFGQTLKKSGYDSSDLTNNELAKTHLRYMVGGRSHLVSNEHLYRFRFPERSGSLTKFLGSMEAKWNISLFHYRYQGGEFGHVLVGLEIPEFEKQSLHKSLEQLDYHFVEETNNSAYRLLLV